MCIYIYIYIYIYMYVIDTLMIHTYTLTYIQYLVQPTLQQISENLDR